MKLDVGCNRYSPKSIINVYLKIYGDLKLYHKVQNVMEVICFFLLYSQLLVKVQSFTPSFEKIYIANAIYTSKII